MLQKFMTLILTIAFGVIPAAAQRGTAPDYVISNIRTPLSADGSEVTITFEVGNIGGPADRDASVNIIHADTGRVIGEDLVPPLQMGESAQVTFMFPAGTEDFPAGSVQLIRIEVGIDEIEPLNGPTIQNNIATISVSVPQTAGGRPGG